MSSKQPTVAKWNDTNTKLFLKVCVEEIEAGNKPHAHFTKEGWNNIVEKFNKKTGYKYEKKQMKNRWDALKQEFGLWARLVEKETGLGWDPVKETIMASPKWWAAKAQENPKYLNWRDHGPKFLDLMGKCFKDVVATGYYVYKPHRNIVSHEEHNDQIVKDDAISQASEEDTDAEQHSFDDISQTPDVAHNLKRKINQHSLSSSARFIPPPDPYSITRCILLLNTVTGLEQNSHLYMLAIRILQDRINRETFVTLMETATGVVIPWLSTFTAEDARKYL